MLETIAQVAIPVVLAVIAAAVAHYFAQERELAAKQREYRLRYLVSSFQSLADCTHRRELAATDRAGVLEAVIADLQLFGSDEVVYAARQFATEMGSQGGASADSLVNLVRDELRREMGLEHISGNLLWLRLPEGTKDE